MSAKGVEGNGNFLSVQGDGGRYGEDDETESRGCDVYYEGFDGDEVVGGSRGRKMTVRMSSCPRVVRSTEPREGTVY